MAGRYLRVLVICGVITVIGVVLATALGLGFVGWLFAGLGALGTLLYLVLWTGARKAAELTGDDLIDLIVVPEGFVTQGGFEIGWPEVSRVEAVRVVRKGAESRSVGQWIGNRIGESVLSSLEGHGGANVRIDLHLPDCKAALARTTSKLQKSALIDDIGKRSGTARAMLGLRPAHEIQPLLEVLQRECAARGVPFGLREETAGL